MLRRIQHIKNIGRFADCSKPGCQFEKETLIFANNADGKSTFTAILHSLQAGNNSILIGKKTFGATGSKYVHLDFDINSENKAYVFQNKKWNAVFPHILIFDTKFITQNIFEGEEVKYEHQENLNQIIIGEQGKRLKKEIDSLQAKSDRLAQQKTDKTREFNRSFSGINMTIDKFCALKENPSIDQEIKEIDDKIYVKENQGKIRKFLDANIAWIESVDFNSFRAVFSKKFESVSKEIETHIKQCLAQEDGAKAFIQDGLKYIKDKQKDQKRLCSFCGQELSNKAEHLIESFSKYFQSGYEEIQAEVNRKIEEFKELDIGSFLIKLITSLSQNKISIEIDEPLQTEIVEAQKRLSKEVEKKKDLTYDVSLRDLDYIEEQLTHIKTSLEEVRNGISEKPVQSELTSLLNEKTLLEMTKKRHEQEWVDFCDEYKTIELEAKRIRKDREDKREKLAQYSKDVFDKHRNTINQFCKEMGADFNIADFTPMKNIKKKTERIFAIKFFGTHKVNIKEEDDSKPNFKNTLSESDKRLLALAFFLSILAHDEDLDKKIVVFDDPVSSFDSERRRSTVQLLADITHEEKDDGMVTKIQPLQKIILTHEELFLKKLLEEPAFASAQTLKIEGFKVGGMKRSEIKHLNIDEEFPDLIMSRIDNLHEMLEKGKFIEKYADDCRIVLEHNFKCKYRLYLGEEIKGKKGIRTFIMKLRELKVGGFDNDEKYTKFERLCKSLDTELHDTDTEQSQGDVETIVKEFFDCLVDV